MPELPEVETIRRDLQKLVKGEKISGFECLFEGAIICDSIKAFKKNLIGNRISKIERKGKYLLLYLSNKQVLVIHLRMTGQLVVAVCRGKTYLASTHTPHKHTRLIFHLSNKELLFNDIRKFGRIFLIQASELPDRLSKLGIEPLSPEFSFEVFDELLNSIKLIL